MSSRPPADEIAHKGLDDRWQELPLALELHPDPEALAREVLTVQMRQFMVRQIALASSSPPTALLMVLLHWGRVTPQALIAWAFAVVCVDAAHIRLALLHRRAAPPPEQEAAWRHRQMVLLVLAGLAWGSSMLLFKSDLAGLPHRLIVLTTICSMAAIGVLPFPKVFALFLVATVTMPVYELIHTGDPLWHLLAGGVIVLAIAYTALQSVAARQMTRGIEVHIKARNLAGALSEAALRINRLATLDELTGLTNRRHAWQIMERLSERARLAPTGLGAWSLLSLDVDHFKHINDTHGHPIGDIVLRTIAERLQALVRPSDTLARLGGEEFIVALPDTSRADALVVAEKLRAEIVGEPIEADGLAIAVTISIGVLEIDAARSLDEAFVLVDQALYRAKQKGRNRVEVADARR